VLNYNLEHLFSQRVTVRGPELIGPVPEGIRLNFYLTGGEIAGPKLHGKVRPVGEDRVLIRTDGVGLIEVCGTIETQDGALIMGTYSGVAEFGEEGYQKFLRGVLPDRIPLRAAGHFATAHPAYVWLNRLLCLNLGEADLAHSVVTWEVYAVR
jgi:hypothetical protein